MYKKAFSLAEILIVLAIIGIVAAMTIPTLINKIQDQENKVRFKKAYAEATQAWRLAIADNPGEFTSRGGWSCTWSDGTSADYNAFDNRIYALKSKMKVIKTCINEHGCWSENYETYSNILGNTYAGALSPYSYSWITTDGMCWSAPFKGLDEAHLLVDTNCEKKPNKIGQDIFSMLLGKDGVIYFAIDDTSTNGKPISSGSVCPMLPPPIYINGKSIDFRTMLLK